MHPSRLASSLLHSERNSHRVRYICKAKKESNQEMIYCTGSTNVLEVGFGQFFISVRDISLTLGLLPPRRHVVRRDSVSVESSRSGLKSECADIFHQSFLWLLRHTDEPQRGQNSCLWYNPVLFWVISVSCWCLAELIFTYYDQHCSTLLVEFNMSIVPGPIHQNNSLLF